MKKTIAILMILVLAGVGLFADGVVAVLTPAPSTASITLNTVVTGHALFGVSAATLAEANYVDYTAFNLAVSANVLKEVPSILTLKNNTSIGFLSGFNSTTTPFYLGISTTKLANQTVGTTATPIDLTITPNSQQTVPGAGTVRGKLDSVEIFAKGDSAQIDLAPEGNYQATITFTVTTLV